LKKKGEVQEEQKPELTEEEEESIATESFGKVNLNYVGSEALAVELYADWNDWEPTPMVQKEEGGSFTKTVTLDPGKYRYRYRVASEDGLTWETDKERPVVTDETGTYNSLQVFAKLLRGKYVSKEHQEMENMTVEEKRRLEARSSLDEGEKRRYCTLLIFHFIFHLFSGFSQMTTPFAVTIWQFLSSDDMNINTCHSSSFSPSRSYCLHIFPISYFLLLDWTRNVSSKKREQNNDVWKLRLSSRRKKMRRKSKEKRSSNENKERWSSNNNNGSENEKIESNKLREPK
jgi:hypothetical protein